MAMNDHYSDHMGKTVTATEAKAHILALLDDVEAGEEVEITRHGAAGQYGLQFETVKGDGRVKIKHFVEGQ